MPEGAQAEVFREVEVVVAVRVRAPARLGRAPRDAGTARVVTEPVVVPVEPVHELPGLRDGQQPAPDDRVQSRGDVRDGPVVGVHVPRGGGCGIGDAGAVRHARLEVEVGVEAVPQPPVDRRHTVDQQSGPGGLRCALWAPAVGADGGDLAQAGRDQLLAQRPFGLRDQVVDAAAAAQALGPDPYEHGAGTAEASDRHERGVVDQPGPARGHHTAVFDQGVGPGVTVVREAVRLVRREGHAVGTGRGGQCVDRVVELVAVRAVHLVVRSRRLDRVDVGGQYGADRSGGEPGGAQRLRQTRRVVPVDLPLGGLAPRFEGLALTPDQRCDVRPFRERRVLGGPVRGVVPADHRPVGLDDHADGVPLGHPPPHMCVVQRQQFRRVHDQKTSPRPAPAGTRPAGPPRCG